MDIFSLINKKIFTSLNKIFVHKTFKFNFSIAFDLFSNYLIHFVLNNIQFKKFFIKETYGTKTNKKFLIDIV